MGGFQTTLLLLHINSLDCGLVKPERRQACNVCFDVELLLIPVVTLYFY